MRLTVEGERRLRGPQRGALIRMGRVEGTVFAATAPTVESGRRRPNRVPNARFAGVADWIPLELYSTEVAARRAFGRHVRGHCRVTEWWLQSARVVLLIDDDDLALFASSWAAFEDLSEPDSRQIAEFVRCADAVDGLITRAFVAPSAYHIVLFGDALHVAAKRGEALRQTLPDPSRRL